jgi:hypothetical protein
MTSYTLSSRASKAIAFAQDDNLAQGVFKRNRETLPPLRDNPPPGSSPSFHAPTFYTPDTLPRFIRNAPSG